jgi:hypothetical protein
MLINFLPVDFLSFSCVYQIVFLNYSHLINYTKSSKIFLVFRWVFLQQVWIVFYLSWLLNNHARKCKATLLKRYYKQRIFLLSISSFLVYLLSFFLSSFLSPFLPFFLPFTLPSFFPSFLSSLPQTFFPFFISFLSSLLSFLPFFPPFFIPSFLSYFIFPSLLFFTSVHLAIHTSFLILK